MDERNLLICDAELRYANVLSENIIQRKELAVRIFVCSNIESALRVGREREIHILIVDDVFMCGEREKIVAQQTFVLTKEKCEDLRKNEKEILKYQSADLILGEILQEVCETTNFSMLKSVKKKMQKIVVVYSPIRRIGKTAFALEFGKEFAKEKRTLYVNLEEYADIGERFIYSERRNLGDLLYYMRQEDSNLATRLSTMVVKMEKLDYVPPILISSDLREVSVGEWTQLFETIVKESSYEMIVIDLGECIQGLWEVLQMADEIYMPILEDAVSIRKIERFEEEMVRVKKGVFCAELHKFVAVTDMNAYARKVVKEEIMDGKI